MFLREFSPDPLPQNKPSRWPALPRGRKGDPGKRGTGVFRRGLTACTRTKKEQAGGTGIFGGKVPKSRLVHTFTSPMRNMRPPLRKTGGATIKVRPT